MFIGDGPLATLAGTRLRSLVKVLEVVVPEQPANEGIISTKQVNDTRIKEIRRKKVCDDNLGSIAPIIDL